MKNIIAKLLLCIGVLVLSKNTNAQPIIADHTVVDKYASIPEEYIVKVKTMLLNIAGESHSRGYRYGLELLEATEPKFAVNKDMDNSPEGASSQYLRVSGTIRYPNGNWHTAVGEEDLWTTPWAVDNFVNTIKYMDETANNPISAMGFGWCYDMAVNSLIGTTDPVYGCRWAGRSVYYIGTNGSSYTFSDDNGWMQWGLDNSDSINLGGPRVTMDMYIRAVENARKASPKTAVFFTTGQVDYKNGNYTSGNEAIYQSFVKHEYIRQYVKNTSNAFLFDYADILCWSNTGVQRTETWNGHVYQKIHTDFIGDYDGGEGGCHVNEAGCLRLGKAMWWMLARIAGWNGETGGDLTAPSVPQTLTASAISSSQINISWNASTDNTGVVGYRIYRNGSQIATTNTTSYSNTGLLASTAYSYYVRAYDAAGNVSNNSNTVSVTTPALPDATVPSVPTGLTANAATSTSVNLSWTASTDNVGVAGYRIYRGGTQIATTTSTTYSNTGLTASTAYSYYVRAYDAAGNISNNSNTVSITTPAVPDVTVPSVPTGLTATFASTTSVNLTWTASLDNIGVTGYRIYRNGIQIAITNTNSYTNTGLIASTTFNYYVRAYDAAGNISDNSNTVSVTTSASPDIIAPTAPTGISVTATSITSVNLSWTASTDNVGVAGYQIYRDGTQIATTSGVSYANTSLLPSTTYSYYVVAYDAAGNISDNSNTLTIKTLNDQTILQNIIADHTVVDQYAYIPDEYIAKVKQMLVNIAGEEHSKAYAYGLEMLAQQDPKYAISKKLTGTPEGPSSDHLRVSSVVRYSNGLTSNYVGEEDVWTTPWAVDNFVNTIKYYNETEANPISAMGFVWGHDMLVNGLAGTADPVYGCRWSGRSTYYTGMNGQNPVFSSDNGWYQWGIDNNDSVSLGGPRVTLNMYIRAVEAARKANPQTTVFFTTGAVDYKSADYASGREDVYQSFVKHEYIRNYVKNSTNGVLFDYADILSWSNSGEQRTETWNGHEYQKIHYDYITPVYTGAEGSCYVNEAACLRLGKAMWWMLARIAGWNGSSVVDTVAPTSPENLSGSIVTPSAVLLKWDSSIDTATNVAGYIVFRDSSEIAISTDTVHIDTTAISSETYKYFVKAFDVSTNISESSNVVEITTPDAIAPSIPNNLKGTVISESQILVEWNSSTDNLGVAGYRVYRNDVEVGVVTDALYNDTDIAVAGLFRYSVRAFDVAGNLSESSDMVVVNTSVDEPGSYPIIADHTVVDQYAYIPDEYLDKVKQMLVNIAGEEHSKAYAYGLEMLAQQEPRYAISKKITGTPEEPSSEHLRVSSIVRFSSGVTSNYVGEEDLWTTPWAVDNFVNTIKYYNETEANPISAMGFVWGHDMLVNGLAGTADPVYGCRWSGRSTYYTGMNGQNPVFSSDNGWYQWGIDNNDSVSLGGPRVTLNMYIRAVEAAREANPQTAVFFTTGAVDYKSADYASGREDVYQSFVKHEYIRDYVKNSTNGVLFDYADILSWSNSGEQRTETWNGHEYQKIHYDYIAPIYSGAEGSCYVNEAACLRLGKAMWWMLARIAGWDGYVDNAAFSKMLTDKIMSVEKVPAKKSISYKLYPNPTTNKITIASERTGTVGIKIIDKAGKTVLVRQFNNFPVLLDIENLPSDIYFINVTNGSNSTMLKVSKIN